MNARLYHWGCVLLLACSTMVFAADDTVSLVFAGDIVLDDTAGEMIARDEDPLALANNHSGDFGREAFAEMLVLLQQLIGSAHAAHHEAQRSSYCAPGLQRIHAPQF
jgi:poly-gamma-glutamate synthesis protein (capsule biosynthesis protein)